jgi:hypothetical protein
MITVYHGRGRRHLRRWTFSQPLVRTVTRVDGCFSLPDVEAHSTRRVLEGTYGVRFAARDLRDDSDENAVVHVDLWDSYLEPA